MSQKVRKLKNYNGQDIPFPHTHQVEDTINSAGTTALATTTEAGFMRKSDKKTLDDNEARIASLEEEIKNIEFITTFSLTKTDSEE